MSKQTPLRRRVQQVHVTHRTLFRSSEVVRVHRRKGCDVESVGGSTTHRNPYERAKRLNAKRPGAKNIRQESPYLKWKTEDSIQVGNQFQISARPHVPYPSSPLRSRQVITGTGKAKTLSTWKPSTAPPLEAPAVQKGQSRAANPQDRAT